MTNELYHYGTPRHSGRYPWGSGDNPYQHEDGFLKNVEEMHKSGMTEVEIAKALGMSTTLLRQRKSIAKAELRAAQTAHAIELRDHGYSLVKIGEMLGSPGNPIPESTVRTLLKHSEDSKRNITRETSEALKESLKEHRFVDVSKGIEANLGISQTKLNTALQLLKEQGYEVIPIQVDQMGTDHKTTIKVLAPAGTKAPDIYNNLQDIGLPIGHRVVETDHTARTIKPPVSIDPKRVAIRYADDGGRNMDGVILLRRDAEDLSLGAARYAQVRIKVGDDMYLKGMAMYSDDLPKGVDIMFNTNKYKKDAPELSDVLKPTKNDADNPFGATISQGKYKDKDGVEHQSPINIVNEEGDWDKWSKTLSSQFLSKQPLVLAKTQLNKSYEENLKEYNDIMSLTNPTVRRKLLEEFSDECDSAAVHLKAAALPRQASKVILPFEDMKEDEIYAPGYKDGEKVVLVRHPHGGIFEIPTLTVNNKAASPNKLIHNAKDAVGINAKVAEQLSGADFDGDTVLVIPIGSGPASKIKTSKQLEQLKDFSPSDAYPAYEGMPKVGKETGFHKQSEMGKISNLITDMTIKGATPAEIARAVKHSMVIIDAEKHNLNWRQSYEDNQIAQLKKKYQGGVNAGAATLISRASSRMDVSKRSQRSIIDPDTGEKIWLPASDQTWVKRDKETGKETIVTKHTQSTKMYETRDARTLLSDEVYPIEEVYADYANKMKALGNKARKEILTTPSLKYEPSAAKTYAKEVESLKEKLVIAKKNSPYERQAQIKANIEVKQKLADMPDLTKAEVKRLKGQAIVRARQRVGAKKQSVVITNEEWEAIQAGAIHDTTLREIMDNSDLDVLRSLATPRNSSKLSASDLSRAKALLKNDKYSQAEVAEQLGVSVSTLNKALNE